MSESGYTADPSTPVSGNGNYGNMGNLRGDIDPNGVVHGRGGWSFYDETGGVLYINTGDGWNTQWTETGGGAAPSTVGLVPVGGVVAWCKNLTGVPSLDPSFVECNGQVLSDAESPLNGQTIPDLNNTGYFLRGSTISGGASGQTAHAHSAGASFEVTTSPGSGAFVWDAGASSSSETAFPPDHYTVVWIMRVK